MHIVQLQPSDAPQYRDLMLQAYELAADAFTSSAKDRRAEPESFWVKRIRHPHDLSAAFGAFDDQALVGMVALEFSAKPKTRHKALVIGMYTVPAHRGKGIGRALLQAAIEHARAKDGIHLLTLTVTEGNDPAISLYRSLGFQIFGVEPMAIHTSSGYKSKVYMWLPPQHGEAVA